MREAYKIRVHDENNRNQYRYLDYAINVEKGGKLKGDNDDNVLVGTLGDDKIIGKAGDDILHGDDISKTVWIAGGDKLYGGDGDDVLDRGLGNDYLHGGARADIFFLTKGNQSRDIVDDFKLGADKVRVQQEWIDKGWVKITAERDEEFDDYDRTVQFKMQFEEGEKLPNKITIGSQIKLGYLSGEDLAAYHAAGGALGVAEADHILLDIV